MGPADIVLTNGQVRSMSVSVPAATAMAIRHDRIAAVGSDDEVGSWIGPDSSVVDLSGRTVIPGFIDDHVHVAGNARDPRTVECRDFFDPTIRSVADILDRLRRAANDDRDGDWVAAVSSPMQETRLAERRRPSREELDEAVPDRPAYITFGPHLLLANSAALDACGIGPDTADPAGGVIERDQLGRPSGLLREVAQQLVRNRRPGAEQDLAERIHGELVACARRGVTAIGDVVTSPAEIRAYQTLAAEGRLPIRVRLLIRAFQSQIETWSIRSLGLLPGFGSDQLRIGAVKLSVDGGSSAGQAAFYPRDGDDPGSHPVLRMTQDELNTILGGYHEAGMQVCVHAVGDLATDMALRSFRSALAGSPRSDHRHRIEHLGNLAVSDERIAEARDLGLIAVPNPSSFHYLIGSALRSFGRERLGRVYPFRSMIDAGLSFVGASDGGGLWPVHPLRDIRAAVTRTTRDGEEIDPHEAISVDEALAGFTSNAAWAALGESRYGSLVVGKAADLAILASDPSVVAADEIGDIDVDLTMCGGRVVFERDGAVVTTVMGSGATLATPA